MRFFISSRIDELRPERKTVVNWLHTNRHEPIFIETEPYQDKKEAKGTMEWMVKRSDALISIAYLTLGNKNKEDLGGLTPIEFEMTRFRHEHKDRGAPILLLAKNLEFPEVRKPIRDTSLQEWIDRERKLGGITFREFTSQKQLMATIERYIRSKNFRKSIPDDSLLPESRFTLQYFGPDFPGLLQAISHTLSRESGANISYISQGARGGEAAILLGCSMPAEFEKNDVKKAVLAAVKKKLKKVRGNQSSSGFDLTIRESKQATGADQLFAEIRTIDAPGQLNEICNVLEKSGYNINDVTLKPAPSEHERQTVILLWLSKPGRELTKRRIGRTILKLEMELGKLIGVRSFSVRSL